MSKDIARSIANLKAKIRQQQAQDRKLRAEILAVEEARQLLANFQSISAKEVLAQLDARKKFWFQLLRNNSYGT